MKLDLYKYNFAFQFVSIPVLASQTKYYFPDLPNLRGAKIFKIHYYPAGVLDKDTTNVSTTSAVNSAAMALTLNSGMDDIIKQLDLGTLTPYFVDGQRYKPVEELYLDGLVFDFSKSFIEFQSAIRLDTCIAFGVFYVNR